MKLTVHQPEHLPWLGFLHKAAMADVMVLLDTVPFRESYFQNRNRIRDSKGMIWLTVPVLTKHRHGQLIKDVRIATGHSRWNQKYWKSMAWCYQKAPHFNLYREAFEELLLKCDSEYLVDLNLRAIQLLFELFRIPTKLIRASDLDLERPEGGDLILEIAQKLKASTYISGISGIAGKGKEIEPLFIENGIRVLYQNYYHPIYQQCHQPFVPFLSAVDLLFNHGDQSPDILAGKAGQSLNYVLN